jgi:hypothetical protein
LLSTIKRWLGITALQSRIAELETENAALKEGRAVVLPGGKLAIADTPVPAALRPRVHSFHQYARNREAQAWKDLCDEAFPNANSATKRPS